MPHLSFFHFRKHRLSLPLTHPMPLFRLTSFYFLVYLRPAIIKNLSSPGLINFCSFYMYRANKAEVTFFMLQPLPSVKRNLYLLSNNWLANPWDLYQKQKLLYLPCQEYSAISQILLLSVCGRKDTLKTMLLKVADEMCSATVAEIWFCEE